MFFKYLKFLYKKNPIILLPLLFSCIPWIFFVINFKNYSNLTASLLQASTGFTLMIGFFIYWTNYYKPLSFFLVSLSLLLYILKQIYFEKHFLVCLLHTEIGQSCKVNSP